MTQGSFRVGSLFGIPIHLSVWYLVLVGFFSYSMGSPLEMLMFALAMTLSLMVHELGHGLVAKLQGLNPSIILHGMGGATFHQRATSDGREALLVAAGPGAGLLLAALSAVPYFLGLRGVLPFPHAWEVFLTNMLWIGVVWSLFNLLPLYPMDGGKLTRLALMRLLGPTWGARITHGISIALCVAGLGLALSGGSFFMAILAGMWGWQNVQNLRGQGSAPAARRRNTETPSLLKEAEQALQSGDHKEAQRLAYMARGMGPTTEQMESDAWEIIAVAAQRFGQGSECLRLAHRATQTPRLIEACALAHLAAGDLESARELTRHPAFSKLPRERQQALQQHLA